MAAALLLVLVAGACSSSGKDEPQARPGVTGGQVVEGDLTLDTVAWDEVSPRKAVGPLDDVDRASVMKTLQATFDATVVRPLTTGTAGAIDALFTADAAARAAGPDRVALFDEGLPRVKDLEATRANVRLTALDNGNGPALVVAKVDWDVRGDGVHVQRIGELSLVPVLGVWMVGAYTVITTRTAGGSTTTTTAASG
ncbi:MAG: hypothetical protein JWN67_2735 [Actinomycetia bacterium]|nr:hypothetical protein [Actinomycetes bacterium]